jgi:two-component system, NtrC family, sensor histidine kinase KinB
MGTTMKDRNDASKPFRGLGLRTKLTLGFVVLLAILVAVGVESISLLDHLGGSIDVILRENYKSVIACERMKESLERMDSGALFGLAGEAQQGRALAGEHRPRFEEALKTELGNITLPGEGERAAHLQQLYGAYVPVLQRVLNPEIPSGQRRALYFQRLYPTFLQIKATADEILQMNQQNMVLAKDRAREVAADAGRRMAVWLLAGTAIAGLCILFLSRAILGPLERLTRAAGEIESGNLDTAVPVTSRDEMGQLAAAFNSMAGGLRELRETDQARLLRTRRLSQSAIDNLPEALAVISPDRQVELANRTASSLLDLRPGEPLPERHREWILPLLDRVESGSVPAGGAQPWIRLPIEGRERLFLPRTVALRNGHGRAEGVVLALEDVTDRRRGSEVHAGLLTNAAHDLERSLGPLQSALESLDAERLGPLTPRQKQRLESARAEAVRLGEVAASLLAMSRLEERRQQLHPEPVAPGDLVDAAVREAAPLYRQEQVKLVTDVDPEAPRVLADRERAGLVLSLLLRNARAHTPAGGSVNVTAEPWEGRVRFAVSDTGSGIPPAYSELIFEPLYQVPGTQDLGDAGLGLSIAKEIVQSHGGEIHAESDEGRGATFWYTLPAALD